METPWYKVGSIIASVAHTSIIVHACEPDQLCRRPGTQRMRSLARDNHSIDLPLVKRCNLCQRSAKHKVPLGMLDGALCMTRGEAQHARRLHAHNSPMSTWRTGYAEATIMSQTPSTTLPSTSWYMTLLSIAEIDRTWAEALLVIILQRTAALAGLPPQGVQCSAVRLPRSGCPPPSHPELPSCTLRCTPVHARRDQVWFGLTMSLD